MVDIIHQNNIAQSNLESYIYLNLQDSIIKNKRKLKS